MSGRTRLVAMATAVALACLAGVWRRNRKVEFSTRAIDLWSHCSGKGDAHTASARAIVVGIADAMRQGRLAIHRQKGVLSLCQSPRGQVTLTS